MNDEVGDVLRIFLVVFRFPITECASNHWSAITHLFGGPRSFQMTDERWILMSNQWREGEKCSFFFSTSVIVFCFIMIPITIFVLPCYKYISIYKHKHRCKYIDSRVWYCFFSSILLSYIQMRLCWIVANTEANLRTALRRMTKYFFTSVPKSISKALTSHLLITLRS